MSEDAGKPLLQDLDGGVLTLTLNRPEALNALDQPLMRQLTAALEAAAAAPEVRVVVLRGAGRAFCAGGDRRRSRIPDPADPLAARWSDDPVWSSPAWRHDRLRRAVQAAALLRTMSKPTIAAVRGPAFGAGLGLAVACDLRIASDSAVFRTAFAAAGASGDYGVAYGLVRLLGAGRARELFLLDEPVDASTALAIGLVTRLVDEAGLEAEAARLARRLADGPGLAYRYMKDNLAAAETAELDACLDRETRNMVAATETADAAEARAAFREGRPPRFRGA